jgi:glyoxylase-like metal-dependent hydrolase (beta-lactamase superfamily II)
VTSTSRPHQPLYLDLEAPATGSGERAEIMGGVYWATMPVGPDLAAINIWLLRDGDHWTVVDTGLRSSAALAAWRQISDDLFSAAPPKRVICTHMHPDHAGLSGWLAEEFNTQLLMSRLEYFTLRTLAWDIGRPAPQQALDFYRAAGLDDDAVDHYRSRFGQFGHMIYPLPDSFHALGHGQRIEINGHEWQDVIGSGPSPEHVCLYCPDLKLFISGDQVLPRISSNVSVYSYEPDADPLSDWLFTLARIKQIVPNDVLVLPSHGRPFHGLHERIDALIAGHEESLRIMHAALLERPMRAVDVFPLLFKRAITAEIGMMAAGETLAHLACLKVRGLATVTTDDDRIQWWSGIPA